mgnify:FL=1
MSASFEVAPVENCTRWPAFGFLVFAIACLVQIVPMPGPVIRLANPMAWTWFVEGWQAAFGKAPTEATWRTLSLAPKSSSERAVRWLALFGTAKASAHVARKKKAWRMALRTVLATSLVVLGIGILQSLTGTSRVLFVYEPKAEILPLSTFISSNHATVFCGFASLCGFGLALRVRGRETAETVIAAVVGLVNMILMLEFGAISAIGAYWVALTLLIGGFFLRRGRDDDGSSLVSGTVKITSCLGLTGPIVVLIMGRLGWFGIDNCEVVHRFNTWLTKEAVERIAMIRAGWQAAGDFWVAGAGAGTTSYVIPSYIDWSVVRPASIPTIENAPVEWGYEFGVPLALVGGVLLAGYLVLAVRRWYRSRRLRYAVVSAVAVFLAINAQFHFPFFALGLSIPMVFVMEVGLNYRKRRSCHTRSGWLKGLPKLGGPSALVALVAIAGGLYWGYQARSLNTDQFSVDSARHSIRQRPADSLLYAQLSVAARKSEQAIRSVRLAEHAFERNPTAGSALFVCRAYREVGQPKKALKWCGDVFGGRFSNVPLEWYKQELLGLFQRGDQLGEVLAEAPRDRWEDVCRSLEKRGAHIQQVQLGLELSEQGGSAVEPFECIVRGYLSLDRTMLAELWARRMIEATRDGTPEQRAAAYAMLVRALRIRGSHDEARKVAQTAIARYGGEGDLAVGVVRLRHDRPDEASAIEVRAMRHARETLCYNDRTQELWCWLAEGWIDEQRKEYNEAREVYRRIARELDHPEILAEYYARRGACTELRRFVNRLRQDGRLTDKQKSRLQRTEDACINP